MDLEKLARAMRNALEFIEANFEDVEHEQVCVCLGVFMGALEEEWPEVSYERIQMMLSDVLVAKGGTN